MTKGRDSKKKLCSYFLSSSSICVAVCGEPCRSWKLALARIMVVSSLLPARFVVYQFTASLRVSEAESVSSWLKYRVTRADTFNKNYKKKNVNNLKCLSNDYRNTIKIRTRITHLNSICQTLSNNTQIPNTCYFLGYYTLQLELHIYTVMYWN